MQTPKGFLALTNTQWIGEEHKNRREAYPSREAAHMKCAYWLWNRAWGVWPCSKSISSGELSPVAGSMR